MTSISLNKDLPEEFFSNILITAFDGGYGESWNWFEPVGDNWLALKNSEDSTDNPWMSCKVRVKKDCETGEAIFDTRGGFVIDHDSIAGGISRIVNDDYLNARPGETASGLKANIVAAVMDPENADLDAYDADAIVQCAAFGKVIFG